MCSCSLYQHPSLAVSLFSLEATFLSLSLSLSLSLRQLSVSRSASEDE